MTEILKTEAISVLFNEENRGIYAYWALESEKIDENFFKQVNLLYVDYVKNHGATKLLIDAQNFRYPIAPELQEWVGTQIISVLLEAGLNKIAMVVSKEMIAQLSIEQTMEENKAVESFLMYFGSPEEAEKWIDK